MNSENKGLPAVLREWAGNYEEGSFDTEAGLMTEAADAIDDMLSALHSINKVASPNPERTIDDVIRDLDYITARARSAISRADTIEEIRDHVKRVHEYERNHGQT